MSFFIPRLYFRYANHAAFVVVVLTGLSSPANAESFDATDFGVETSDDPPLEFSPVIAGAQVLGATAFGGAGVGALLLATAASGATTQEASIYFAVLLSPLLVLVPALVGSLVGASVGALIHARNLPPVSSKRGLSALERMEQASVDAVLHGATGAVLAGGIALIPVMSCVGVFISYVFLLSAAYGSGSLNRSFAEPFALLGGSIALGTFASVGLLGSLFAAGVPVEE